MNIDEFLEARIAEDEAVANEATGARWVVLSGVNASLVNIDATQVRDEKWKYGRFGHIATTSHDAAYAAHIARHDPARVLAECAAKRAIAGLHKVGADQCDEHNAMFESIPCPTIRALAAVYKDHPDYQQDWA
jgi:hypothetical protein